MSSSTTEKTKKVKKEFKLERNTKFLGISSVIEPFLTSYGITIDQYFLCELLFYRNYNQLYNYAENVKTFGSKDVDKLISLNFIKLIDQDEEKYDVENLETTGAFNTILKRISDNIYKKEVPKDDILIETVPKLEPLETWFDSWYNLFPQGVKSGGYLVKSGKQICQKKLNTFIKTHPEFTKEQILEATKRYISDFQKANYAYMKIAPYFIEKGGVSTLEDYCNNSNTDTTTNNTTERSI